MITVETLRPMCSRDRTRPFLTHPFTDHDGFTYATCGRAIVRARGLVAGATVLVDPAWAKIVRASQSLCLEPFSRDVSSFRPLPKPSPRPAPVMLTCECCDGAGCDECDRVGKWDSSKPVYDVLFGTVYNVDFLHRVREVAGDIPLVCALGAPVEHILGPQSPLLVRPADGSDVLGFVIMPVNVPVSDPHIAWVHNMEVAA